MRCCARSFRPLFWTLGIILCASLSQTLRSEGKSLRSLCSSSHRRAGDTARRSDPGHPASAVRRAKVAGRQPQLPLAFEPNEGQTDGRVRYLARGSGYTIFLTPQEAVLSLTSGTPARGNDRASRASAVLALRFATGNPSPRISSHDQLPGKSNYFVGSNPALWRTNIPRYGKVNFDDVYPGIGLVYYGRDQQLEQDWVVSAGADPDQIAFDVEGADGVSLDSSGDLRIGFSSGELSLRRPTIYQFAGGKQVPVKGRFLLASQRQVRFRVGAYDRTKGTRKNNFTVAV